MSSSRPQKPPTYEFESEHLIRALFDADSDEAVLLELAAMNKVELHASGTVWNTFLWLMMNTMKDANGSTLYSGAELGKMKNDLPIKFH